jgi:hypothetical protein
MVCPTKQRSRNQTWGGRPVRAGPPGPALPVFEQVDQGVDRGPGGPPHKIVEGCGDLRVV